MKYLFYFYFSFLEYYTKKSYKREYFKAILPLFAILLILFAEVPRFLFGMTMHEFSNFYFSHSLIYRRLILSPLSFIFPAIVLFLMVVVLRKKTRKYYKMYMLLTQSQKKTTLYLSFAALFLSPLLVFVL